MNNAARTSRRPLPPRILRLCAELGIRLLPAEAGTEYTPTGAVNFAVESDSRHSEEWIVVRSASGEAVATLTHWGSARSEWGAQRIYGRQGARYLERAHIYRTARTLPELLREVAS